MLKLNNRYYALRHGESTANVGRIIVSDPAIGVTKFGLSEKGKLQVAQMTTHTDILGSNIKIFSSDFLRAKETAVIVHKRLNRADSLIFTSLLRERFFGELNDSSDDNYQKVWSLDSSNPNHKQFGCESVNEVLGRCIELIETIEAEHNDSTIVLVAHGDVLQIMQTWFEGVSSSNHRQLRHLNTAELRRYYP